MERAPITRQRSAWILDETDRPSPTGYPTAYYWRKVNSGTLWAIVADEPSAGGWHLSISFRDHRGEPTRYPTWDEIAHARDALLPDDVGFVMHLPAAGEYVALHATTFHLHEYPERSL